MRGICINWKQAYSESVTLPDIVHLAAPLPTATIYVAEEIVTLAPNKSRVDAVYDLRHVCHPDHRHRAAAAKTVYWQVR